MDIQNTVIIGAGPGGLSAMLYLGRGLMNPMLLEKAGPGGQMLLTDEIANYVGFPGGINAFDLVDKMTEHAKSFGGSIEMMEVSSLNDLDNDVKTISCATGEEIKTRSIIIASGAKSRTIGVPGEKELAARGVSYCGTCDGAFFKDKVIAVIGGGDTAFDETLFLTRFAKKIFLIHRRQGFRAAPITIEKVRNHEKVELVLDTIPLSILGKESVSGVRIKNVKTEEERDLPLDGVFIFIGQDPVTGFLEGSGIETSDSGYIITDRNMRTNFPGVFAVGDVVEKEERQVANAVGEGAVAACQAIKYVESLS